MADTDWRAFARDVERAIGGRKASAVLAQAAAAGLDLNKAALSRARNAQTVGCGNYSSICQLFGLDVHSYTIASKPLAEPPEHEPAVRGMRDILQRFQTVSPRDTRETRP